MFSQTRLDFVFAHLGFMSASQNKKGLEQQGTFVFE